MTDLPPGWEWAHFSDVARVASNLVDPVNFGQLPHIAPNHIESGTGKLLDHRTVAEDGVASPKHLFRPGQILYSKIRPYLAKVITVEFAGLCSADMYPIDTGLHPRFLKWWMLTSRFTEEAIRHQGRSVLPKINVEALSKLCVPVPPLAEQRRIVATLERHLTHIEAAVANLRLVHNKVRSLVSSSRNDVTKRFSSGEQSLGDLLADIEAGKSFAVEGRPAGADEWGIIKISAMTWGEFKESENKAVPCDREIDTRHEIKPGDILLSRANTEQYVGAAVLVDDTRSKLLLSDKSLRLVPKPSRYLVRLPCDRRSPSARRA